MLATVQGIIMQMPPLRREIFCRRRLNGESLTEIATTMKMTPAAVEKHLVRGLADIHAAMNDEHVFRRGRR